jgi:hypothetical protein
MSLIHKKKTDKRGWCVAITTKLRGQIEKNEIDEEEPYQKDEMSNVDDVIVVESFDRLCVQEEKAEEVPSEGDIDEDDEEVNGEDDEGDNDEDVSDWDDN